MQIRSSIVRAEFHSEGPLAYLTLKEVGMYSRTARTGAGQAARASNVNRKPWVAEITGVSDVYGYEREFVRPYRDFRNASRSGRSGIQHWFFLPPGMYEALEVLNSQKTRRFFFRSLDGKIEEITREEVDEWLRDQD